MKQVVQSVKDGLTTVRDVPAPAIGAGQVLVGAAASLISAGTERYVVDLARKSLIAKARARPDHVRRVVQKVREEGLTSTLTQVRARLDEPMPLGYSVAGVVLQTGAGVGELKPGDPIAAAAPHAALSAVGRNLVARAPDGLAFDRAAYASVASIAMQGVRLARVGLGDRVLVVGLGLVGQLCVSLLAANGCRVIALDVDRERARLAEAMGAERAATDLSVDQIVHFANGYGVDAVVLTASTPSNGPIELAAEVCRPRGRVVLVGVVGLDIPRAPFYAKELEFTVSHSLGPGRDDPTYEEKGIDYPIAHTRWTAQRNMEACLGLMAAGKLPVEKLTTHRFPIERAAEAYDLITSRREPFLGIVLEYPAPSPEPPSRRIELRSAPASSAELGVSLIGAGNFARLIMLPALAGLGGLAWRGVCTAHGMNAEHTARQKGFAFATTDVDEVLNDPGTHAVFVATRHNLHADLVVRALRVGKHVFVEKPLCITAEELAEVRACVEELGDRCPVLTVGFNRRFAPATELVRSFMAGVGPLTVDYRFAPGPIPSDHWTQDPEVGGGRIVGEACHAIDTCVALTGSRPVRVYAESVADAGAATDDRVAITMRHENGGISRVSYEAGGDRGFPAERIELYGGGRTAVVQHWEEVELWRGGRRTAKSGGKDRGHRAELAAFVEACRRGGAWPISWDELYATSWATLAAVESLRSGMPVSFP